MVASVPLKEAEPVVVPETSSVAAVPLKEAEPVVVPETLRVASVPLKAGALSSAAEAPVITVLFCEVGRVTAVGVLGVKAPWFHAKVRVSPLTVALQVGSVAEAATPAITLPASSKTATVSVLGVTVMSGLLTLPAGV